MLQFINVHFKKQVIIEKQDAEFINCTFSVEGNSMKDTKGTALVVAGAANVKVVNCVFKNKGYNSINLKTSGYIVIERNTFISTNVYNPIEATGIAGNGLSNVFIENNIFNSTCGNNYISFFHMADNAIVEINSNLFSNVNYQSNILRLSNPENVSAIFKLNNNKYRYNSKDTSDYTAFVICQEYGEKSQDFSKYILNITNLKCNNEIIKDVPAQGILYYSYKDNVGIVTGLNDPIINLV